MKRKRYECQPSQPNQHYEVPGNPGDPAIKNLPYAMYRSPFREENTPSLKVSHQQNLWVDYGEGNGGTLIDLVLRLHPGYSVSEAIGDIAKTENNTFSFHQQPSPPITKDHGEETENSSIHILRINELGNNPVITHYIQSRGITIDTARDYCKELYFRVGGKNYFGVGTPNERGWSIRNAYWKGCTGQGYTHYHKPSQIQKSLSVFEGIFDLLSYLEIKRQADRTEDFLVLNSLVNVNKAIPIIKDYPSITLFLDHDVPGRKATRQLLQMLPGSRDGSEFYCTSKDLNEYYVIQNEEHRMKNTENRIKNKEKSTKTDRSLRSALRRNISLRSMHHGKTNRRYQRQALQAAHLPDDPNGRRTHDQTHGLFQPAGGGSDQGARL